MAATCVAVTFVLLSVLVPSMASAAFRRPFLKELAGSCETPNEAPSCSKSPGGKPVPFSLARTQGGGVAVDGEGDLWVGDGLNALDEFAPAYKAGEEDWFLGQRALVRPPGTEHLTAPESLAIDTGGGLFAGFFYATAEESSGAFSPFVEAFTGGGVFDTRWQVGFGAHVAVDNSSDSSAGAVYATSALAVSRFGGAGVPEAFANPEGVPYVTGNEIIGGPGCGTFNLSDAPEGVTVDGEGNIFVADTGCKKVLEYRSGGSFVRSFAMEAGPLLAGRLPEPLGVAVDPVSGHLLVTVSVEVSGGGHRGAVEEFDAATGGYLGEFTEAAPGVGLVQPVQLAVDSHGDVFVVDVGRGVVDVFGGGHYAPSVRLGVAGARTGATATLAGAVDPETDVDTEPSTVLSCVFQYVPEAVYDANVKAHGGDVSQGFASLASGGERECVPAAAALKLGGEYDPVDTPVAGLTPGVTYRYRLVAESSGVLGGTEASTARAFTAPREAELSASASNVSASFADLRARIAPFGAATSFFFEYGPTTAYGHDAPALTAAEPQGAAIGSGGATGGAVEEVLQHLGGLSPGTEYHFRVVAVSQVLEAGVRSFGPATAYGSDGTFTTLPLPGAAGRAYELVTPAAPQGNGDLFAEQRENGRLTNKDVGAPASSGTGFLLEAHDAFGPFPFAGSGAYAFTRDYEKGEWKYKSLADPSLGVQTSEGGGFLFDPLDLSQVAFTDGVGALESETGETATSLAGPPGGPYATLREDPAQHEGHRFATNILGGSQDLTHVVLQSTSTGLCTGEPAAKELDPGSPVLCEWSRSAQQPGGPPVMGLVDEGVEGEGRLVSRCGADLGVGAVGGAHAAVSADGSRIFFTAPDPKINSGTGCWSGGASITNAPQLYMRSAGHTLQISAPEPAVSDSSCPHLHEACHPAVYWGASEDGSRVFFLSQGELTSEAQSLGLHDLELYQWEALGAPGPAVACGQSSANYVPGSGGCLTRVSAGEPGGEGRTAAGARIETVMAVAAHGGAVYFTAFGKLTEDATAGAYNLYRYDTATGRTTYVTDVNGADIANYNVGENCSSFGGGYIGSESFCPASNWFTTPDGRFLLFPGTGPPSGFTTHGGLTRYDAATGTLTEIAQSAEFARSAPSGASSGPVRAMSDDGEYVFFDSTEPLVTQASAGTLDVYQWHHGVISLIGSANNQYPSFFLGYSPNPAADTEEAREGGNVFIGTHANLVPGLNTESQGNIFDARICEPQSPCIKPPAGETVRCSGGHCQTPPPAPAEQTPNSQTFTGAGNQTPQTPPPPKPPTAAEIRAKHLTIALKLCRKKASRHRRATCERAARKKYGPVKMAKKSTAAKKRGHS